MTNQKPTPPLSPGEELADLKRRQTALRQELLSRHLKDVPTEALEKLAGEIRQRIEKLEPTTQSLSPETVELPFGLGPDESGSRILWLVDCG